METVMPFETYMTLILYDLDFQMTLIFEQASVEHKYAVTLCEIWTWSNYLGTQIDPDTVKTYR